MLKPMEKLMAVVATLRSERGCPWDREQTHASLKPMMLEELHEFFEALDEGDDRGMCEELGDLLLLLAMQAQIAAERGAFYFDDTVNVLCHKLIARHPHVFSPFPPLTGEAQRLHAETTGQVLANWQKLKAAEKPERTSRLDGIPKALPSLARAEQLQKKAARAGFDWPDASGVLDKIGEEVGELREAIAQGGADAIQDELGDLFFSLVNFSRFAKIDPEDALRRANLKFETRFREVERSVAAAGLSMEECPIEILEQHWQRAKQNAAP